MIHFADTNVTTRAEAPTVNATSGQIESVNVSTLGVGYTGVTNVRIFGTGTNVTFRVVSALILDLVMISAKI